MSITPSLEKFNQMYDLLSSYPVRGDAEQGFLNQMFARPTPDTLDSAIYLTTELPVKYNLMTGLYEGHRSAWDKAWPDARLIHFTLRKPWPRAEGNKDLRVDGAFDIWDKAWVEMVHKFKWVVEYEETRTCKGGEHHWCKPS